MERLTHERINGIKTGYWSPSKKQDLVDRLSEYEDTGLTPEQIRQIDDLYAEKCREVAELRERDTAKEPAAVQRPEWKDRMLHAFLGGHYGKNC